MNLRFALLVLVAGATGFDQDAATTRTARISGYVVSADTGRPAAGVTLRLSLRAAGTDTESTFTTTADAYGAFVYSNLSPGAFTLVATSARHLTWSYGQRRSGQPAVIHTLSPGQHLEVEIAIPKPGAITGRVVDPFGDPVPGVGVFLLAEQDVDGVGRIQPFVGPGVPQTVRPPQLTDDQGQFRLFGLRPGEYYLGAFTGALTASHLYNTPNETAGFAPTYFPGALSIADAERIVLMPSQELSDLTIAVIPSATRRISGVVIDSTGKPLARALMSLNPLDPDSTGAAIAGRAQAREDGTFVFSNVPLGEYVLQGRSLGTVDAFTGEFGWTTVSVATTDLTGIHVTTFRPSTMTGRFSFASGDNLPDLKLFGIQIAMPPVELDKEPVIRIATGDPAPKLEFDGVRFSFEMGELWGRRLIRLRRAPGDWRLERVTIDGKDVTDVPIDFTGRSYADVEIVLTNHGGAVSGRVVDGEGRRRFGGRVVVFAADPTRWTPHSRFVAIAPVSESGAFRAATLPPGEYLAAVVPADVVAPKSASFLQSIRRTATPLSLVDKEVTGLELVER